MGINIDMTGVTAGSGFAALPGGDYNATISKIEQKIGQDSGKPYLEFTFSLDDHNGRMLWKNYSLQPNALWGLKGDLTAIGYEVPDGPFDFEPSDILNTPVTLAVSVKPHWKGEIDPSTGEVKQDNEIIAVKPRASW